MPVPSQTFLFDGFRSGRSPFSVGEGSPREAWKTWLPSHPPRGAESSPAFDEVGNLYFGSHDGCFYSLTPEGAVRWMFKTDEKIYSSPAIQGDVVYFCGGNGYVYAFKLDGTMQWNFDLLGGLRKQNPKKKALRMVKELPKTMDWGRLYNVTTKSWASPVLDGAGNLLVTGYGSGLVSLSPSGEKRWMQRGDGPQYELAGSCLGSDATVYTVFRAGKLKAVSTDDGKVRWEKSLGAGENWCTPSFDAELGQVYAAMSWKESRALLACFGADGAERWRYEVKGGMRGTATISPGDDLVVPALDGRVVRLDRKTGQVRGETRLSKDSRGIWTSAAIDAKGRILLTVKEADKAGSLVCLESDGKERWKHPIGKALSTPVIDANGRVFVGSWDGYFRAIDTN